MRDIENTGARVNDRSSTLEAVCKAALEAHAVGLCINPPAEDGTKRPMPNAHGTWDEYKEIRPTSSGISSWYPGRSGLGVITGAVSGHVECWDFDDRPTYERFVTLAQQCGLGEVVACIEAGYCDDTPAAGVRWLVKYPREVERKPGSGLKLARRPKTNDEKQHPKDNVKVLIELPAYAITAPTNGRVHPSGRPYVRRSGEFSSIAAYTLEEREALIDLAVSFDAMPRSDAEPAPSKNRRHELRPGDDFDARSTWDEILTGWTKVRTRGDGTTEWRRPGKKLGISATTNHRGADRLYVFTSSSEFDPEKSYSRFAAYAVLNHGSDFKASAQALAGKGYGTRTARTQHAPPQVLHQAGDYRETENGIEWCRRAGDVEVWVPLTNFVARIVSDIIQDDGVESSRALEIEATIHGRKHIFTINANMFTHMGWPLDHLGAEAVVQPGQGSRDRARAAIQMLSGNIPQRRVYTHTGWRQVDGQWVYMHGGGALGPDGTVGDIEVQLPEQLDRYVLPDVDDAKLRDAVAASLAMRSVAPAKVMDPLLGAIPRAAIGGADFSLHISGPTGAQKSELAALAQQHYGAGMDARALPASWSSTSNALEATASAAKDTLLSIDDYVPQGTTADRVRLNAVADRVLRAQGNRSGRQRLRSDATMRRTRPPRGLIISTGEEVPGGQSLRARMVIIEVQRGDVNLDRLTVAQSAAAQGAYASATAGFLRWLAPRLEETRAMIDAITRERRTHIGMAHARTADALAQLFAAWVVWLKFVVEIRVATWEEAEAIKGEVWSTLTALATEQQALQRAQDPVERFYSLLNSVLSSGKAHIASAISPDRPPANAEDAKALGWRRYDDGTWHHQGPCIGWWAEEGVYLDPESSYALVQQLGASSGEGIGVASATLHRRMYERNLLLSTEQRGGETRLKPRKSIGGRRRAVLHVAHNLAPYVSRGGPSGPSGQEDQNDQQHQAFA